MIGSQFEEFASAMAARPRGPEAGSALRFDRIAVLGGGADALMLAALCLAEGAAVTLFSAYGAELEQLRRAGGVTLRGEGPIGTFQTDRDGAPSIRTTGELDAAGGMGQRNLPTRSGRQQGTHAYVRWAWRKRSSSQVRCTSSAPTRWCSPSISRTGRCW